MAVITSAQSGNFSSASTWTGGVVPTSIDEARASAGHTIYIDQNTTCQRLTNTHPTGTGRFVINNGITVTANVDNIVTSGGSIGTAVVQFLSAAPFSATIVGNIKGGDIASASCVSNESTGTLNVVGYIEGGTGGGSNTSFIIPATLNPGAIGVHNKVGGIINITGNIAGNQGASSGNSCGAWDAGGGMINVVGNILGIASSTAGLYDSGIALRSSSSVLNIVGNVEATANSVGINSASNNIKISGNILNSSTGRVAIYSAFYRIDPIPQNGYIRYARNGTGVGADAWLFQFTTDSLSAFSMPPVSAVRLGTTFANATLTGTCVIPSPSSVAFGVPTDNTVGQAILTTNALFDTPLSAINTHDTIGMRLKNAATTEAAGYLLASFTKN